MALVTRRNTSTAARARTPEPEDDGEDEPRPTRRARTTERPARAERPKFQEPEEDVPADEDDEPADKRRAAFKRGSSEKGGSTRSRGREEDDRADSDAVQSGWGAANKLKKEGGNFANEFSITKDAQLVAFLEDEPYAIYKQHWIDGGLRSTKKKSFICAGKGCPLCTIGENAAKKWAFNVAALEDDEWVVYSLIAGSRLFDNIADEHEGADGPLNEGFWTLSKSGVKSSTTYKLKKVEGRKLDDYLEKARSEFTTEDELLDEYEQADLVPYTKAQHQPPKMDYLQEIADELVGDDD